MSSSLLLFPPPLTAPIAPLEDLVARANAYATDARASATRRAYLTDFRSFEAWCAAQCLVAMPATAATIVVLPRGARGAG